jgi:CheY-like chemotaxis protein
MPHGGRLTLECANAHVDGRSAGTRDLAPGDYAVLAVSDSGVGMTPDVLERIFEPFYTTKGAGKGTGLGLATVDGIARQFGGVVTAYSEPGIGSTFKLYLPRDTAPAEAAPDPVSATARDHGNELILLVEDDVTLRTLNARILTERGFRVQAFEDGHRALEVADDVLSGASMLLTDVVLPSINGREVAERLHRRAPHLKVLFVSGYTEDSVLRNGILEQGMRFLAKPFGPDDLVARVRAVLDN